MSRVLIVNMPFSNLRWPNLGPSLLKAALVERRIGCEIAYFNFDFAERIGLDHYGWIADHFAFVLGGERLFARHYFEGGLPGDDSYWREVLLETDAGLTEADRRDFEAAGRHVEPFLEHCIQAVDWPRYAIVGFAASFQQTMPSMCLARRIKHLKPQMQIAFGGAACEAEMGIELLRQFPEIDHVFLGEADLTFPPVAEQILQGKRPRLPPGVIGSPGDDSRTSEGDSPIFAPRKSGQSPAHSSAAPDPGLFMVRDMDALPYPDFDDYFARLEASPFKDAIEPLLFFETSRGCWWGQKHQCKFCGLNGSTLVYRSKGPRRVVDELRHLVDRHDVHRACSSDNILDHRYFKTLLPMLKHAGIDLAFVFEMKTNLTRRQVEMLMDAGMGAAQLGIETFITPVLKLIGKGANALQNLQTLKWFSKYPIEVKWNVLYGFPGENPADYAALADLIPSIVHLAPPMAVGRVRLDRFSPYFEDPAGHGMADPRPNKAFPYVYPFPDDVLRRMAYYYEYDYADGRNPLGYAAPALEAIEAWQELNRTVTLRQWDRPDGVLILTDTRPCAAEFQRRLTGLEREIYLYCDTGRSLKKILELASQRAAGGPPRSTPATQRMEASAIQCVLDRWLDERIMAYLDDRYLSLALGTAAEGVC